MKSSLGFSYASALRTLQQLSLLRKHPTLRESASGEPAGTRTKSPLGFSYASAPIGSQAGSMVAGSFSAA